MRFSAPCCLRCRRKSCGAMYRAAFAIHSRLTTDATLTNPRIAGIPYCTGYSDAMVRNCLKFAANIAYMIIFYFSLEFRFGDHQ